ncbi:exodeoxyribonuclease V subunit gamma [Desulfobacula sp.]|uniref:exodeoxyribonuclease V subunit gamma n=1 Tax=Desulfobacula sp. TaxID=2593537 RepID=UPI0026177A04|nr:exodeoxyribonuclease V subunit gamma [Desulfobacula sp.]
MFNIFKSNKMENLMDALASVLSHVPDNPMMPEWIGIQSRGMKQWIAIQMAQNFGVCANMHFLFPRQMVDQILTSFKPLEDQQDSLNEDFLFWSVMKLLNENRSQKESSSVENYIKEDETGKKLCQLSMKIAKVFDDYQVYRPHMLIDWQKYQSHETFKDPVVRWQAKLWNQVVSKDPQNHISFKARLFLEKFSSKTISTDNLPPRMSLFGISALPELFLQVFEKVSEIMDINLFLLTPSNQFFFDIKSERQIGRMALREDTSTDPELLYYEMTNPLLSSLGISGKGFHSCLEAFNYHEPFDDLFADPPKESGEFNTMLAVLQSDILNLIHRKEGCRDAPVTIAASDTSICVHACHSPMREAQVLKDLLLNEFEKDPDLAPHDIIVMMPDIEAYAPFIESVFSLETPLPFSISDRRKRSESEPLDAFLKILALKDSRLEQSYVLDLLLSESIAKKFNITFDEISMIEKMVEDAKIFWGRDAGHRETLGLPPFEENTWQFGLQRLFMGMAMPENQDVPVQDILPCQSFEGLDLEVLGKLAAFCHTLFSCLETLTGQKTIERWCEALKKISVFLMDRNFKNGEDLTFLIQTIDQLKEDAEKAGFDETVTFDMIFSVIEQKLEFNISQGNFLAGNITFCNVMPMRSIPFKIVVLMGMDEKSFPRQAFSPGFNLIKKYPRAGDKSERDEDRYLFLETLLSVRSKFIITYTGMSIQDNSKIPCAGVVSELLDTMDQSFIFQEGVGHHFFHPLHPFNEEYFNQNNEFLSFSKDNCNIAKALSPIRPEKDRPEKSVFIQASAGKESKDPPSNLDLDEMIRFFKNPVQSYMKEELSIKLPDMEEKTYDREVFSISGLDQYTLGSFLVEKNSNSLEERDFYTIIKAMGSLPFGEKGKFEYEKMANIASPVINAAKTIANKKQLPPVVREVNIDGLIVSANFSDIREDGVYFVTYGKLNSARLLSGWIRHLFLNISVPSGYPKKTILIGRDPKGKKPVLTCSFPALGADALKYFKELTQIYEKGGEQPFYFFCETSWQFVQAIAKENLELDLSEPDLSEPGRDLIYKAMNKSMTSWYGGYYQTGEKENRYVSICVENNDPFENVDALFSSGFVHNAITVYKPLLENLKTIS